MDKKKGMVFSLLVVVVVIVGVRIHRGVVGVALVVVRASCKREC